MTIAEVLLSAVAAVVAVAALDSEVRYEFRSDVWDYVLSFRKFRRKFNFLIWGIRP